MPADMAEMKFTDNIPVDSCILVTGAGGFIGVKVVEVLLESGFTNIRCLIRSSSRLERLTSVLDRARNGRDVDIVTGDLLSQSDCEKAAKDVSVIYHLAAGMEKSFAGAFMNSALATRNLIEAFLQYGQPKRFVNVSSFAVYSTLGLKRGSVLDETCSLEDSSQERHDAYGFGKLKQEQLVKGYGVRNKLPYVILRPGYVFGPGKTEISGRVGINTFGFFVQIGGSQFLPMTFVDNCAEAIVLAGLKPGVDGETFNVVDDELLTNRQFFRKFKKATFLRSARIPYSIAYGMSFLWEKYSRWSKDQLPPAFNRRRCTAEWKPVRYSNQKARQRLGWKPRVPMEQAMEAFLGQFKATAALKR